jgi:putative transposase
MGSVYQQPGTAQQFQKDGKKLTKDQRRLARKKKLSANWKKQQQKITRPPTRIADARNDSLHNASSTISKNHAVVCIGDAKRRDMFRSASATSEAPGKKVRARWNSSLLDRGWFEFRRQPEDKLAWSGDWLLSVVPQNTSRTCPACGRIVKENRKRQTRFRWLACGFGEHADLVGAMHIKRDRTCPVRLCSE